jgi:NAD(P)H-quinone oxidoreductase subunit 5
MNRFEDGVPLLQGLAWAIPAVLALAALAPPFASTARRSGLGAGVAMGLALVLALGTALLPIDTASATTARLDGVTALMLVLVTGIGLVIVRYSRTYLRGEPGLPRYLRWLLLMLSAVTALVVANDLLVIVLAWSATSLALHQLLTFYPDRTAALVAAHKKFLLSRLADASLLVSLPLIHANVGSLRLDRIAAWATAHPSLTPSMHAAAVLVTVAVALKSAQLPFHGWLMQVMEAPTPVSAVLHAGVVNIGGFVLIRLAPWLTLAWPARSLLVIVGLTSAVVASLVMTTRVSVKVALAWSTCAQMGFMLVQCGLGAWDLALLHLVAHSLYKAHGFLSAGSAVADWQRMALTKAPPAPTPRARVVDALIVLGGALLALAVSSALAPAHVAQPSTPVLATLVALSLLPLSARRGAGAWSAALLAARAAGVVVLYTGWHLVAARALPSSGAGASAFAWGLVGLSFVALFLVKATLEARPDGRLARALHPWLFAGLYLDERFTRLTFRVWPPRLPPRPQHPGAQFIPSTLEEVGT